MLPTLAPQRSTPHLQEILKDMEELRSGLNQQFEKSEEKFRRFSKQASNKQKEQPTRLQNMAMDVKGKIRWLKIIGKPLV